MVGVGVGSTIGVTVGCWIGSRRVQPTAPVPNRPTTNKILHTACNAHRRKSSVLFIIVIIQPVVADTLILHHTGVCGKDCYCKLLIKVSIIYYNGLTS